MPIPPELVAILREHLDEFGTADDGRLFAISTLKGLRSLGAPSLCALGWYSRQDGGRHRLRLQTLTGMETKATFRLFGDAGLTAAAVTHRLGIQPTHSFEADDPVNSRSASTHVSSIWLLSSSVDIEDDTELTEHLHRLLAILEPVTAPLWELVHEGYEANWFCYIASHATEHAAELDRPTLQRLLALPGDLWLDVCGEFTDEE